MSDDDGKRAQRAREFFRGLTTGMLATMSLEHPGYPFGSITPFAPSIEGRPLLLVSDIAQHTRNMMADPKVSLLAADEGPGNAQARGRVTLLAEARPAQIEEAGELLERYQAFFPESRAYGEAHGFSVFVLEPVRIRFIGGFGDIFWIEAADWLAETPAWIPRETEIRAHMNDDHGEALLAIARRFLDPDCGEAVLVACDGEGCHIRAAGRTGRVAFDAPALEADALRGAFVALAKAARTAP